MSTEVATQTSTLPAMSEAEAKEGSGKRDLTTDDLLLPKLQIAASKSKFMSEGNEAYIEGLREGQIFNTLTEEVYGKEVFIAPVKDAGQNRVMFTPSFGVDCKSDNGIDGGHASPTCAECPFSKWGSAQKGPGSACTLFQNYVVDVVTGNGKPQMALVSFKKKSIETWKKLNSLIELRVDPETGTTPTEFRGRYRLGVGKANGESGQYDIWSIKNAGWIDTKDFPQVQGHYERLKTENVKKDSHE
jgi:hypothetical protein